MTGTGVPATHDLHAIRLDFPWVREASDWLSHGRTAPRWAASPSLSRLEPRVHCAGTGRFNALDARGTAKSTCNRLRALFV